MSKTGQQPRRPLKLEKAIAAISKTVGKHPLPSVSRIARKKRDPFKVLVSTVLSLRTKDAVTMEASSRLFELADTPARLQRLPVRKVERTIYPVGFYKTKARTLRAIARRLVEEYEGKVPDTVDELLKLKGVGRKTATLVVSMGYGKPAICVDTHVHRVSNRLGIVETSNPHKTEFALMEVLPRKYWIGYNALLVAFGQRVCTPVSPRCTTCPLSKSCPRVGVVRIR